VGATVGKGRLWTLVYLETGNFECCFGQEPRPNREAESPRDKSLGLGVPRPRLRAGTAVFFVFVFLFLLFFAKDSCRGSLHPSIVAFLWKISICHGLDVWTFILSLSTF